MKSLVAEPKLNSRDIIEVALNLSGICERLEPLIIRELCQTSAQFQEATNTEEQEGLIHNRNLLLFHRQLLKESIDKLNELIEPNLIEGFEECIK